MDVKEGAIEDLHGNAMLAVTRQYTFTIGEDESKEGLTCHDSTAMSCLSVPILSSRPLEFLLLTLPFGPSSVPEGYHNLTHFLLEAFAYVPAASVSLLYSVGDGQPHKCPATKVRFDLTPNVFSLTDFNAQYPSVWQSKLLPLCSSAMCSCFRPSPISYNVYPPRLFEAVMRANAAVEVFFTTVVRNEGQRRLLTEGQAAVPPQAFTVTRQGTAAPIPVLSTACSQCSSGHECSEDGSEAAVLSLDVSGLPQGDNSLTIGVDGSLEAADGTTIDVNTKVTTTITNTFGGFDAKALLQQQPFPVWLWWRLNSTTDTVAFLLETTGLRWTSLSVLSNRGEGEGEVVPRVDIVGSNRPGSVSGRRVNKDGTTQSIAVNASFTSFSYYSGATVMKFERSLASVPALYGRVVSDGNEGLEAEVYWCVGGEPDDVTYQANGAVCGEVALLLGSSNDDQCEAPRQENPPPQEWPRCNPTTHCSGRGTCRSTLVSIEKNCLCEPEYAGDACNICAPRAQPVGSTCQFTDGRAMVRLHVAPHAGPQEVDCAWSQQLRSLLVSQGSVTSDLGFSCPIATSGNCVELFMEGNDKGEMEEVRRQLQLGTSPLYEVLSPCGGDEGSGKELWTACAVLCG